MDSLDYLQEKLIHLQAKYPHHPRYCAWRMMFSSLVALCGRFNGRMQKLPFQSAAGTRSLSYKPAIVFDIKGGLGDLLIANNYIYCLWKYLDGAFDMKICYHIPALRRAFCQSLPGVVQTGEKIKDMSGVLKVELNRFPRIVAGDRKALRQYNPRLGKVLGAWDAFFENNRKFFDFKPQLDGISNEYTHILGNKRISQADIGGLLEMGETYLAPVNFPAKLDENNILNKFGLKEQLFITLQRGQGIVINATSNTKLWPVEYYNELISLLRRRWPQYKLVQLGTEREGFNEDFVGIDLNLRGQTNLEELKVLLAHSMLHIDCEGGLVHLRHALQGGPSVVLFGPTAPEVYGYAENLNLRSGVCKYPCEWVTNDWVSRCARRKNKNGCMKELTPQFVFEQLQQWAVNPL